MTKQIINYETPIGNFFMVLENQKVIRSGFGVHNENLEKIKDHAYKNLVKDYFNGDKTALKKIKYQQSSTDFTNKVWDVIANIPYGKTINYQELAKGANRPRAIRAAASACGRNNITLIIPCHRIIRSDGSIGEYFYGPKIKNFLLHLEQSSRK